MKKLFLFLILFLLTNSVVISHPGIGIVVDQYGNVYFTDLDHVWQIDISGEVSIAVEDVHTHQLIIDDQGAIEGEHVWYIEKEDIWPHFLWRLTATGEFEKTTDDIMEFPVNNYLVRDPKGNSYFAESGNQGDLLIREKPDGSRSPVTRKEFKDIGWIQYSKARKTLLVVDHTSIKEVSLDGGVRNIAEDLGSKSISFSWVNDRHKIMGVWTDNSGNIYACNYGAQKVIVIDQNGVIKDKVTIDGLWSPSGGVYDREGNLWLLEYSVRNKARVRKISKEGAVFEYYPE